MYSGMGTEGHCELDPCKMITCKIVSVLILLIWSPDWLIVTHNTYLMSKLYFINPFFTCVHNGWTLSELYQLLHTDLVFVIDDWTLHKQLKHVYVSTKVNMNKFETNEFMSNWKNELEICWNKLKCNFSKIILILILKGKRAVPVQLYIFIIFMCLQRWIWINLKLINSCQTERMNLKYVEINWNVIFSKIILILILKRKRAIPVQLYIFIIFMCLQRWIWINLKLMNSCQTERMNLKYVEINWNVIFSKIILILILKHKRAVPIPLYILSCLKGIKVGQLSCDATRQSRQLCVMADKWVAAPATPQQLTYAAGGTSILVLSGRRVKYGMFKPQIQKPQWLVVALNVVIQHIILYHTLSKKGNGMNEYFGNERNGKIQP